MEFHDRLKMLIEERHMTQKQVAQELKIAPSTLGGYVQGTSEPDFETLRRIAGFFQVSSDYLLGLPESPARSPLENDVLRIFRSLSSLQQMVYLEQGKAFSLMDCQR